MEVLYHLQRMRKAHRKWPAKVTEVTGGLANPKHKEMEILDAGYQTHVFAYRL